MAIAPIDLQTLFSQVDKVGRAQLAQREGQAIAQSVQGAQFLRKTNELDKQVNETQDMGDGTEKIKDRSNKQNNDDKNRNKNENNEEDYENDEPESFVLREPALGKKIDISY
ncbi:MAG: hypothetical protein FWC97_02265 [Treponema sp.]|nr:hypothetical protein [Treponema sp.]